MQNSSNQLNNTLFLLSAIYFLWLIAVLIIFGYTPTNDGVGYIEYAVFCLNQGQPYPSDTIFKVIPFIWNVGHGEPRFKDPFMPFIFILSAVGIYHIIKSK